MRMDVEGGEKEMKTEAGVDVQCKCGFEGEETVGGEDSFITGLDGGNSSETSTPHKVGKDAMEEDYTVAG